MRLDVELFRVRVLEKPRESQATRLVELALSRYRPLLGRERRRRDRGGAA
jgi:hypothetical protein